MVMVSSCGLTVHLTIPLQMTVWCGVAWCSVVGDRPVQRLNYVGYGVSPVTGWGICMRIRLRDMLA